MKKWMFFSLVFALMPLSLMAQDDDDMYFASSKKVKAKAKAEEQARAQARERFRQVRESEIPTYYAGSKRSVDEYNRMGSSYETLPADTGDIISFDPIQGVYPDSVSDFQLTQKMVQYDDYVPGDNYWAGYADGRLDEAMWHSPWYHSWLYPWYDPWYDHWYWQYGWYDPWYSPWYYDYGWGYGWRSWYYYRPYYGYTYYGGGGRYYANGNTGTLRRYSDMARTSNYNRNRATAYGSSSRFDSARQRAANGNSGRLSSGGGVNSRSSSASTTRTSVNRNTNRSTVRSNTNTTPVYNGNTGGSYSNSSGGGSFGGGGGSRSSGGGCDCILYRAQHSVEAVVEAAEVVVPVVAVALVVDADKPTTI